jgi:hypothetical protein
MTTQTPEPRLLTGALARIADLKPHPRNYRVHTEDQLEHIETSIREHGFYRNVVVANDGTILAGHGVVTAAERLGLAEVTVVRLDIGPDHPKALKILAADNEIAKRAEVDDRALSELLREIKDVDVLLGTGFDDEMLAALVMNTRPTSEIRDFNAAAEWVGMPAYENGGTPIRLVVTFNTEEDRTAFVREQKMRIDKKTGPTWSTRWPFSEREDVAGFRFEGPAQETSK